MDNRIYVGNLSWSVRDEQLQDMFAEHGNVNSAKVMVDRDTGRSKGFGFVEMASPAEAQAAISALNGRDVDGRALTVNIARPMEARAPGGGGYGGGGGGGGGYGSGYGGGNRGGRY